MKRIFAFEDKIAEGRSIPLSEGGDPKKAGITMLTPVGFSVSI
jgi:hypothetical protein